MVLFRIIRYLIFDQAGQDLLMRSFRRSTKARPLHQSNMVYNLFIFTISCSIFICFFLLLIFFQLFFPILHQKHWFVFVVDIKDRHFVFLDSYYNQNSKYHEDIKDRLVCIFPLFLY